MPKAFPRVPLGGGSFYRSIASTLLLASLSATAAAQVFDWQRQPPGIAPPARSQHAMAYDASNARIVLFGGASQFGGASPFGDTWLWHAGSWLQAATLVAPPARRSHAMACDATAQQVVLFGGFVDGVGQVADTWLWNGTAWAQAMPANSPAARTGHAMAFDAARQRLVLFGGTSGGGQQNDTWEWDGANWALMPSLSNPVARAGHAMSYDVARQRVVMYGGSNATGVMADTWEWNGTAWSPAISATFPPARTGHVMAYDASLARTILFGGSTSQNVGETWQWDGTNWSQVAPAIGVPAPRVAAALAYSVSEQQLVLFGGDNGGSLPDTWIQGNDSAIYGAGCGAPALGFQPGTQRPFVGQTATATIVNAATPVAAVAIGVSRDFFGPFPLPLPLGGLGMTGCELWQSSDIIGLPVTVLTPSSLAFGLALPNVQGLVGRHIYAQALALAPTQNALGVVVSNGIDWRVGCPPLPPQSIVEDFASDAQLDRDASAGQWLNGFGRFAAIGGDARHGDFDVSIAVDTGITILGRRVFEIDCDHTVIPASRTTTGTDSLVTDGRFFFGSMVLQADQHLRFVGSNPPVFTVAGTMTIHGVIDVSGASVGQHTASALFGQPGGAGGVFGGAGGKGGDRCLGVGPGTGQYNGVAGEAVKVLSGHAYAGAAPGTAGSGSLLYPATGLNADQQFGAPVTPAGLFYCLSATAGGAGGGLWQPGQSGQVLAILSGSTPLPNQASFIGPPSAAGQAMQILPLPGSSISSQHFLLGGAGGGGAASNSTLSLSIVRTWASGAAGGGGGGALALRAGNTVNLLSGSRLLAMGGGSHDYIGVSAGAQVAPGGGGSGGSILVQATNPSFWMGEVSLAGGRGGVFRRQGGSGIGPVGGIVEIRGGDGGAGYLRCETQTFLPLPSQLGTVEPPVTMQNIAPLQEVDVSPSMRSKFYSTNLACSPQFSRYELQAMVNGSLVLFSDDPAVSPLVAGLGAGVRVLFQAGNAHLASGEVQPVGPWRKSVRSAPGQTGIDVDGGNAYRFMVIADRTVAATLMIDSLTVVYQH